MINSIKAVQSVSKRLESIIDKLDGDTLKVVSEAICELDAVEFNIAQALNDHNNESQILAYEAKGEFIEYRI
jgi:hypothetical protein